MLSHALRRCFMQSERECVKNVLGCSRDESSRHNALCARHAISSRSRGTCAGQASLVSKQWIELTAYAYIAFQLYKFDNMKISDP